MNGDLAIGRGHPGRGAWLCPRDVCAQRAVAAGSLVRGLGRSLNHEGESLLEVVVALLEGGTAPKR